MGIRGPKDFYSGLMFILVGLFTIVVASSYPVGTAARMGPGYFPRALGWLLIIMGAVSAVRGLRVPGEPVPRWFFKPLIIVLVSVVVFGLIIPILGMAISTVLLVLAASSADPEFRPKEALISGILLSITCVLVFIHALHLTLPVWPAFFGG